MAAVLDGMRSGKSFSTTGDLINALDFTITNGENKGEMGQNLKVKDGDALKLTIRFKSPQTNNYAVIKSENPAINDKYIYQSDVTNAVKVDHVDLIAVMLQVRLSLVRMNTTKIRMIQRRSLPDSRAKTGQQTRKATMSLRMISIQRTKISILD